MLSLKELKRSAAILERRLSGTLLHRVAEVEGGTLALSFRSRESGTVLLLCCRPEFARLGTIERMPESAAATSSFAQYLRARLPRAGFGGIHVEEKDRQAALTLVAQEGAFELILSIMGTRSNIYLLSPFRTLVHAARPLEETRRELSLGGPWSNPEGRLRTEGEDRWECVPDEDFLDSVETFYRNAERVREADAITRRIETALGREESFLDRKLVNLQEDLGEARRAQEYKRKGELLKGILHQIHPGDSSVSAADYESGETVTIPLDASLSPAENLEAYFGRYQKELRGIGAIEEQLASVRGAQARIAAIRDELRKVLSAGVVNLDALERLSAEPAVRRLLGRHYPRPKPVPPPKKAPGGMREVPARLLPKRYRTAEGLEVWVGRNDDGNDYLTTKLARGNDLFLHLEGYPGSHVVLRTEGRTDPPPESLLAACELAVHYSKLKSSSRADVHVAYIKDVKKPKGARKGLVYVTRGKTIHLRRDPKRLEGILSSRLDSIE